jgi:predicted Rossmann fold flavoprotein
MVIAMGGRIQTDTKVKSLVVEDGAVKGVRLDSGDILDADAVIVTTGGASYPGTGSSGDGYRMAKDVGHMIVPLTPSLVPLEIEEDWIQDLQGLSLRNVSVVAYADDTKIDSDFGEMLFTHFGVSGPIVLSMSRKIALCLEEKQDVVLSLDLKPALSEEQLDRRVQRDFEKYLRKQVKNALNDLLPQKLIPVVIDLAYLDEEKPIHQVTKEERLRLVHTIKHIEMTVTKTRPMAEAIVTAGGVSTKEVNPKTMASRIVNGLYFAGEVLDIDGYTGGFNLQAAFSTGYSAGKAAAESLL